MELKAVRYGVDGCVATITLDRPERLNAWTGRMHTEYRWCLAQAEADPVTRAIVITGAGRGFCAGADSTALVGHVDKGGYDPGTPADIATPGQGLSDDFDHDFAYHFGLTKPVIAAINGPAAGVGFVLACFCDIRFAARGAKLTTSHAKLGLPAEFGLSWLLPKIVGVGRANDLLFTSRTILAEDAVDMGLVNACVEPDELLSFAYSYAREFAQLSPGSVASTKAQVYLDMNRSLGRAAIDARDRLETMMKTDEFAEGVAALRDKRAPAWPGSGSALR